MEQRNNDAAALQHSSALYYGNELFKEMLIEHLVSQTYVFFKKKKELRAY